jgi:hypothetical protein
MSGQRLSGGFHALFELMVRHRLPGHRHDSPMGYWLLISPLSHACDEVNVFSQWLIDQAADTTSVLQY